MSLKDLLIKERTLAEDGTRFRGVISISPEKLLQALDLPTELIALGAYADCGPMNEGQINIKVASLDQVEGYTWPTSETGVIIKVDIDPIISENIPTVNMNNQIPKKKIGVMVFKGDIK